MSLLETVQLYKRAGKCSSCFDDEIGMVPKSGCRLPQPRWIGPQYWRNNKRILVCMVNPGIGKEIEHEYESLLRDFFIDKKQFFHLNDYFRGAMRRWGGGKFVRVIENHMGLDLNDIALMNIALCPMTDSSQQNYYPEEALDNCFKLHTRKIMRSLEPNIVVLCGSSIHRYQPWIERQLGAKVVLAPHYASRLRLTQLQETYSKIRKILHD